MKGRILKALEALQNTNWIRAQSNEIPEAPVGIHAARLLDVVEHGVQGQRVAMNVRQERDFHLANSERLSRCDV